MEPDIIKELLTKSFTEVLLQKPYTQQTEDVQEFLKVIAAVNMVADVHAATECVEYKEEIEDKDLGLVRKINLN